MLPLSGFVHPQSQVTDTSRHTCDFLGLLLLGCINNNYTKLIYNLRLSKHKHCRGSSPQQLIKRDCPWTMKMAIKPNRQ